VIHAILGFEKPIRLHESHGLVIIVILVEYSDDSNIRKLFGYHRGTVAETFVFYSRGSKDISEINEIYIQEQHDKEFDLFVFRSFSSFLLYNVR